MLAQIRMHVLQIEQGFALVDILREIAPFLFSMEVPVEPLRDLVATLCDIEEHLSVGTNHRIQLAAVAGAFAEFRLAVNKTAS